MVKSKTKLMRIGIEDAAYLKKLKEKNKLDSSSAALNEMINFFKIKDKKIKVTKKIIQEMEF
ncbi:MAG TPA: hypothetical protein VMX17_03950 [Candidatus Glassbacteria bacterium]|nr:hypothetical protein [Candidatus Glassbacteria bacterium]